MREGEKDRKKGRRGREVSKLGTTTELTGLVRRTALITAPRLCTVSGTFGSTISASAVLWT